MAKGGYRLGSGRKASRATIEFRKKIADRTDEAEKSFSYMCAMRDNNDVPLELRANAARWVYETVCGKPAQASTLDVTMQSDWRIGRTAEEIALIEENGRRNYAAMVKAIGAKSEPSQDSDGSESS